MAAAPKSGYFGIGKGKNKGTYTSPSGKHFDLSQVQMFYSHGGKFPGQKAKSVRAGWRMAAHQRRVHGVGK